MPRTLEGELKVDNEEFRRGLQDPESDEYLQFANNFVFALKNAIFNRNDLENSNNEVMVELVQLRYVRFNKCKIVYPANYCLLIIKTMKKIRCGVSILLALKINRLVTGQDQ